MTWPQPVIVYNIHYLLIGIIFHLWLHIYLGIPSEGPPEAQIPICSLNLTNDERNCQNDYYEFINPLLSWCGSGIFMLLSTISLRNVNAKITPAIQHKQWHKTKQHRKSLKEASQKRSMKENCINYQWENLFLQD